MKTSRRENRLPGSARHRADAIVAAWRLREKIARSGVGGWTVTSEMRRRFRTAQAERDARS